MKDFHDLIEEICKEEQISFSILSKDWIVMLEKNNKTKFIAGYKFDLNAHGIGNVMDDKYATFEVLRKKQIPIIEHKILFKPNNQNEYAKDSNSYKVVEQFFKDNQENIVLKANDSSCGLDVFHITSNNEIITTLDKLFKKSFSISICPFYDIKTEYRIITLNKRCILCYGKKRAIVTGDGYKSIYDLLCDFNPHYFTKNINKEDYPKILNKGEIFEYSWQFNLSKGSVPFELENENLKQKLYDIVNKITNSLDLGFCSIDIIKTSNNEFLVMEINSGVMMKNYMQIMPNGKNIVKKVYKEAILEMFKDK